ncbi:hypothetical protein K2173_021327 [Erythroxylum novogranatense]|uniref:HMA domain-containing protein n=1 Tax=Erythroxylum novogranatense TaxID=1862640 RepID=A0AAV8TUR7_9ROSI|nr:hypothetical protein K2173_021327 [Erythroxylum novogranatense]
MVQRTVLKVDISCLKCKTKVLKAISAVEGVDKIEVDETKGTVTVTGKADPYDIIVRTRKAGKYAEVVSVGPPPPPPKPETQKKPDEKNPEEKKPAAGEKKAQQSQEKNKTPLVHDPHTCPQCQRIVVIPMSRYDEPNPSCTIM